jgi:hypothetical protein
VPAPGIFSRQDCEAAQTPLPLPLVRAVEDIDQGRIFVLEFIVPQKIWQTGERAAAMGKQAPMCGFATLARLLLSDAVLRTLSLAW